MSFYFIYLDISEFLLIIVSVFLVYKKGVKILENHVFVIVKYLPTDLKISVLNICTDLQM